MMTLELRVAAISEPPPTGPQGGRHPKQVKKKGSVLTLRGDFGFGTDSDLVVLIPADAKRPDLGDKVRIELTAPDIKAVP